MNYEEFQRLLHEADLDDTDDRYISNYNNERKLIQRETTSDNISSFLDDVQKRYQSLIEDLDTINKPPDVGEDYDDICLDIPTISLENKLDKPKEHISNINYAKPNIDSEMMKIIEDLINSPNKTSQHMLQQPQPPQQQQKSKESRIPKPKTKNKSKYKSLINTVIIPDTKLIPTENLLNHKINEEILQMEANSGNYIAGIELAKVRINEYKNKNKDENINSSNNNNKIRNEKIEKNLKELSEKAKIFSKIPIEKKELNKNDENKNKVESKILKEMPEETVIVKKAVKKAKVRITENKSKFKKSPTIGEKRLKQLMKERDIRINNFYKKYFCN